MGECKFVDAVPVKWVQLPEYLPDTSWVSLNRFPESVFLETIPFPLLTYIKEDFEFI